MVQLCLFPIKKIKKNNFFPKKVEFLIFKKSQMLLKSSKINKCLFFLKFQTQMFSFNAKVD